MVAAVTYFVCFSLAFAAIAVVARRRRSALLSGDARPAQGPLVCHEQFDLSMQPHEARWLAVEAILAAGGSVARVEPGRVAGFRSAGVSSWGEILSVWLWPEGEGITVLAESRPVIGALIDWGQGERNIALMSSRLSPSGPPSE